MHAELLIGGVFFGGPCDQGIGKTRHDAPYDGLMVGTAAEAGWSEFSAALDAARSAFEVWRGSSRGERQGVLRRTAVLIRERSGELSELLAREVGKPLVLAAGEVERAALTFDLAADLCSGETGRVVPVDVDGRGRGVRCVVERVPVGVVLCIVPFNWPLNLAAHKVAPALAAGNTVVVKGASVGALTTLTLGRILHEAGCPDGVVNFLHAPGALAEKASQDRRVDMVSFTGSPSVGWRLKGLLPGKRVSLELGGDATVVVGAGLGDGDLDWAVSRIVPGAFGYAGQVCISVQHVLAHGSVYADFRERLVSATEAVVTGDPMSEGVLCGPLVDDGAADRVLEWVSEAESAGGRVLCGGSRVGRVVEPVLVEGVARLVRLGCEEVFGPVATLGRFEDFGEATRWVNGSRFGIQAGVFTRDMGVAEEAFRDWEVGGVVVNDSPSLRFDGMPYGGVKESGFGREGVLSAFCEMSEEKVLLERRFWGF